MVKLSNLTVDKEIKTYGLLFSELDSVYGEKTFVLAYGNLKKVKFYKEDCRLKGDILEYTKTGWLVKKIENIKDTYRDSVSIIYID